MSSNPLFRDKKLFPAIGLHQRQAKILILTISMRVSVTFSTSNS